MAIKDSSIFTPKKFNAWSILNKKINTFEEVDFVVSFSEMKELVRSENPKSFKLNPISAATNFTEKDIKYYKKKLLDELPFYKGLIYSNSKNTIQSALYIRQGSVFFLFSLFTSNLNFYDYSNCGSRMGFRLYWVISL